MKLIEIRTMIDKLIRYITKLLAFFLFYSDILACSVIPSGFYSTPPEQVDNAQGIYLVKNVKSETIDDNVFYYFDVLESLKGKEKKSLILNFKSYPYSNKKTDNGSSHYDYKFWLYGHDRTGFFSDCNVYPSFKYNKDYLYFKSDKLTSRSYEAVGSDDLWYKYVKQMTIDKVQSIPVMKYQDFISNFDRIYKFRCPDLSKSERFTSFISMLKGKYEKINIPIPEFYNGQSCIGTGIEFVVFIDNTGRKTVAPINDNYIDFTSLFNFELIFKNKLPLVEIGQTEHRRGRTLTPSKGSAR